MNRGLILIFFLFLPLIAFAQSDGAEPAFDIKTLRSSDGRYSIYSYIDSLYLPDTACDSLWQEESFRIQIDRSGSTVSVQALFHPESCKSRRYTAFLYHIRWRNVAFGKGKTLYLNFEERKVRGKSGR